MPGTPTAAWASRRMPGTPNLPPLDDAGCIRAQRDDTSYTLSSLKGGHTGDFIGEHYRGIAIGELYVGY